MTTARAIFAAALVATTVAVAGVGSANAAPFHPHHRHGGWGWGAGGLAAGLVIGSAIASQRAYEEREPRCFYVERVNRWGEVVARRVCRW